MRRAVQGDAVIEDAGAAPADGDEAEPASADASLAQDRYSELGAREQVVLTLSQNGYGKRTSAYEYRVTGRGGKGIVAMVTNDRNGKLVSSFPVEHLDQLMLITDRGQTIRVPVDGIRIAGRSTQGVIVFDTAEDERVVSVEHIEGETEASVVDGDETNGTEANGNGAPEGDAGGPDIGPGDGEV